MTKRTKLILAILAGLVFIAIVVASVWNTLFAGAPANIKQSEVATPGEMQYSTYTVYPQDPVSFNATAQLQSDNSYYYDATLGEIETIYVRDGQFVKKGDILYSYFLDKNKYDLEDALREQTKLYNQREELISQLAKLTGGYYNYRGDLISTYWTSDGKQQYAVIESIGKSSGTSTTADSASTSEAPSTGDGSEEGIKAQIRQVNSQIEDVEIKLIRLKEQQHGQVKAKFSGKVVLDESGKDNASVPLVRIISDEVAVEGAVSEYEFYVLGNDRPVTLFVNAEERSVTGKMVAYDNIPAPTNSGSGNKTESTPVAPTTSEGGTRYRFTIAPDEFIQPGFSVKVQAMMPGYVVPQDALLEENGQFYVFVVRDKVAHKLQVKLERQGVQRVVLQGLNEGDALLLHPYDVKDGQVVSVAEPADFKEGVEGMPKEQVGE